MTDKQFTDEEIIKALELCNKPADPEICNSCPFCSDFKCLYILKANALNLINRQKAEIEKLENARQKQAQFLSEERGQKYELIDKLSQVRIAAYKDFADMVRDTFFYDISNSTPKEAKFPCAVMYAIEKEIEKALKEMVGEDE